VSDFTVSYPRPDDVDRYSRELRVSRAAVVRDIVRIVTVAHMAYAGELNEEWVLSGSMGLRLRGSPRFTMMDTDTSRVGLPDDTRLASALRLDHDDLVVVPAAPDRWRSGRQLLKAQPVDFEAFFASVGIPATDSFTFTVSWRGLFEPADRLALGHPYSELILPRVEVPVMNLTEQTAEKIVGWCVHGLMKHYVDVAWIFNCLREQVAVERLARLVERKLEIGRELFGDAYAAYPDLRSLFKPLYNPDSLVPPLGEQGELGIDQIRFAGPSLSKYEAVAIVRDQVLPALFSPVEPSDVELRA
jgi:hypothetical protein